jgi:hypothetical protein
MLNFILFEFVTYLRERPYFFALYVGTICVGIYQTDRSLFSISVDHNVVVIDLFWLHMPKIILQLEDDA